MTGSRVTVVKLGYILCVVASARQNRRSYSQWFKCLLCCLQLICKVGEGRVEQCVQTITDVVHSRTDLSSKRQSAESKVSKSQPINMSGSLQPEFDTSEAANGSSFTSGKLVSEPCGSETLQVSSSIAKEQDFVKEQETAKEHLVISSDTASTDNILIVDNINNPAEFSSSKRILKEVNNFCPNVKVEFAYSLARGRVAIHTADKSGRDLLLDLLPEESFGGGVKHLLKHKCSDTLFVKGICTSVSIQEFSNVLKDCGIHVNSSQTIVQQKFWQTYLCFEG